MTLISKFSSKQDNLVLASQNISYIDELSLSQNTIKNYKTAYKHLSKFLNFKDYNSALYFFIFGGNDEGKSNVHSNNIFRQFSHWLLNDKKLSKKTIELYQSALKEAVATVESTGLISWKITARNIKISSRERESKVTALTENELIKLLDYIDNSRSDFIGKRNKALVYILLYAGLRRSELVNIKISDISFDNQSINIIGKGAGTATEWIFIPDTAWDAFLDYLKLIELNDVNLPVWQSADPCKKNPKNGLTSTSVSRILSNIGNQIGINLHPHRLRHTFATIAAKAHDYNLEKVSEATRHKSLTTLKGYIAKEKRSEVSDQVKTKTEQTINDIRKKQ